MQKGFNVRFMDVRLPTNSILFIKLIIFSKKLIERTQYLISITQFLTLSIHSGNLGPYKSTCLTLDVSNVRSIFWPILELKLILTYNVSSVGLGQSQRHRHPYYAMPYVELALYFIVPCCHSVFTTIHSVCLCICLCLSLSLSLSP